MGIIPKNSSSSSESDRTFNLRLENMHKERLWGCKKNVMYSSCPTEGKDDYADVAISIQPEVAIKTGAA